MSVFAKLWRCNASYNCQLWSHFNSYSFLKSLADLNFSNSSYNPRGRRGIVNAIAWTSYIDDCIFLNRPPENPSIFIVGSEEPPDIESTFLGPSYLISSLRPKNWTLDGPISKFEWPLCGSIPLIKAVFKSQIFTSQLDNITHSLKTLSWKMECYATH